MFYHLKIACYHHAFVIFLLSSRHYTHILNLHIFRLILGINVTMSYHASFPYISYFTRLTRLDLFELKWLNSHIFYKLYGFKDIDTRVGEHGCEL